jgi:hypothetical protein
MKFQSRKTLLLTGGNIVFFFVCVVLILFSLLYVLLKIGRLFCDDIL